MEAWYPQLVALLKVVLIDLVLAGDNAVVVGMAASKLPRAQRKQVIFWAVAGAVVLRILFAVIAAELLAIIGLTLAGGILLLWVAWKIYRDISRAKSRHGLDGVATKTFRQALFQIVVADVSMSLDNVLAVAGAARHHFAVMAIGLLFSVALMAIASHFVARLLSRYPWLSWLGLLLVTSVALRMIYEGSLEVAQHATGG